MVGSLFSIISLARPLNRQTDLALTIVDSLGVLNPEHPTLTPVPSQEFISASLEREAVRRIFWYIHFVDVKAAIYFKKPITFTPAELRLRLPVDETSFELGVHSTLPGMSFIGPHFAELLSHLADTNQFGFQSTFIFRR